jgi:hypothetical protein
MFKKFVNRTIVPLLAFLAVSAHAGFVEMMEKRTPSSRTWVDTSKPEVRYFESRLDTVVNYPSDGPDSSRFNGAVDFSVTRINDAFFDGWITNRGAWRCALGKPGNKATDGWVGLGGRQGESWVLFRLARAGYLYWPTRAFDDVSGVPTYNRTNLTRSTDSLTMGPAGAQATIQTGLNVVWRNIWTTPNGGELYIRWTAEGRGLKEEVVLSSAARSWISANHAPATPLIDTYFAFVFQMDVSSSPRVKKDGVLQDISGDFDDSNGLSVFRFEDASSRFLFTMPVDLAYSANGQMTQKLVKRFWLDPDGNQYLLVGIKIADLIAMPTGDIIFDPTVSSQPDATAGIDTDISLSSPTFNNGTITRMFVTGGSQKSLVKFDLSSIDKEATCDTATLSLWSQNSAPSGDTHNVYSLHSNVSSWAETEATWTNYKTGSAWPGSSGASTSGTDYEATVLGTLNFPATSPDSEVQSSLSKTRIQGWFGASNTNYGLVIADGNVTGEAYWTSDFVTAGERPKFVVTYTDFSSMGDPYRMKNDRGLFRKQY